MRSLLDQTCKLLTNGPVEKISEVAVLPRKERKMPKIAVEPDLYDRIQRAATAHHENIDDLLDQAIRRYLWELDRRKISQESRVYKQVHPQLVTKYLGQYIAMHNGQVVDFDPDFAHLRQRVHQKFGDIPVMITLVEAVAEQTLTRHGFQLENKDL